MIYYTIYVKRLNNGVGYIDVALEDDQLLKDFEQYLDIGVRPHRSYRLAPMPGTTDGSGLFTLDMSEVTAITTIFKDKAAGEKLKSHVDARRKHDTSSHTRHTTR
jgi:hypothetical protein